MYNNETLSSQLEKGEIKEREEQLRAKGRGRPHNHFTHRDARYFGPCPMPWKNHEGTWEAAYLGVAWSPCQLPSTPYPNQRAHPPPPSPQSCVCVCVCVWDDTSSVDMLQHGHTRSDIAHHMHTAESWNSSSKNCAIYTD